MTQISKVKPSITDFFTDASCNTGGHVQALEIFSETSKSAVYIVNQHGIKLLKIAVKNEPKQLGTANYAQLKIIHYGFKKAWLWRDQPDDPKAVTLRDDVELTYHGSQTDEKTAKIHLKGRSGYQTLLDNILELPQDLEQPTPLFGFESGYAFDKTPGETRVRSGHVVKPDHIGPIRYEFYLMSNKADVSQFVNSTYFINMFFSLDFMSKAQHGVLQGGQVIAPIRFLPIRDYWLIIRRSTSGYKGEPRLIFYNNFDYKNMWLNRKTAYPNADGTLTWSTMQKDEARLRQMYQDKGSN